MTEITIDPEIANLCRALTDEEKAQLEANLKADGCRNPLVLWDKTLLDGHNRREICSRLGITFRTEQVENIKDRNDAINWVIANQLGRRNLIPEDVSYLRGKRYEAEKLSVEERAKLAGAARKLSDQNDREAIGRDATAKRLAANFGVGSATVRRDAAFAAAVDMIGEKLGKATADLIRTGKSGLSKAAIRTFVKDDDMTLQKFNDLRFDEQKRRAKTIKERKKSAPKAPSMSTLKKPHTAVDTTAIERMRPFMNALIQIATSPVKAETLASYAWPETWRKQVRDSLPLAQAYLDAFAQSFTTMESTDGNQAEADQQRSECA